MPRIQHPCLCGCGQPTRGEFATGHHGSYRLRLLREAAEGSPTAQEELTIRGWLPEQGYSNFGTQPDAEGRTENRRLRRAQQTLARQRLRQLHRQAAMQAAWSPTYVAPAPEYDITSFDFASLEQGARTAAADRFERAVAAHSYREHPYARRFGVEIEYVGADRQSVVSALEERGLSIRSMNYNHDVVSYWKIVSDASLEPRRNDDRDMTGELVSPPLEGAEGLRALRLALRGLRAAGATVNTSCGLHVHHEIAPDYQLQNIRRVLGTYFAMQSHIDRLMPRSRRAAPGERGSTYCEGLNQYIIDDLSRTRSLTRFAESVNRYSVLNVRAFALYGTLEFRQHAGTLNYRKARAWIRFGQALLAYGLAIETPLVPTDTATLGEFLRLLGMSRRDRSYLVARADAITAADQRRAERPSRRNRSIERSAV